MNLESEESLEIQIEKLEIFTDRTKQLLKKFTVNVESTLIDESGEIYVLWIRGVKEYRQYKKQNPKAIRQNFFREDQIICHILEYADDVMIWDNVTESYDIDGDEYLLSWITGSDGYNYVSIANLNPNWLISMYVLHGLLKHAQMLFGYEIGGRKEND